MGKSSRGRLPHPTHPEHDSITLIGKCFKRHNRFSHNTCYRLQSKQPITRYYDNSFSAPQHRVSARGAAIKPRDDEVTRPHAENIPRCGAPGCCRSAFSYLPGFSERRRSIPILPPPADPGGAAAIYRAPPHAYRRRPTSDIRSHRSGECGVYDGMTILLRSQLCGFRLPVSGLLSGGGIRLFTRLSM